MLKLKINLGYVDDFHGTAKELRTPTVIGV
jgi:hypothetical protein